MYIEEKIKLMNLFFEQKPEYLDPDFVYLNYTVEFQFGMVFEFTKFVYEDFIAISVIRGADKTRVLDIDMKEVSALEITDDKMCINFIGGQCHIVRNSVFSTSLEFSKFKKLNLNPIRYDKIELLELFCNLPIIINESERIVKYDSYELNDFIVSLTLFEKENLVSISLIHTISKQQIFYVNINNVDKLESIIQKNYEQLIIHSKTLIQPFIIQFKPKILLKYLCMNI